jgi:hypothetical protein
MPIRRIRIFYVFRKDFPTPPPDPLSDPLLIFFLFCLSKRELPLTELERLGIWAARQAREWAKKNSNSQEAGLIIEKPVNPASQNHTLVLQNMEWMGDSTLDDFIRSGGRTALS